MKIPVKIGLKVRLQLSGCGRGEMWLVYSRCICNCVIQEVLNSCGDVGTPEMFSSAVQWQNPPTVAAPQSLPEAEERASAIDH